MNQARYRKQWILAVAAFLLLKTVSGDLSAQEVSLKGHSGAVMMATFAAEDGRVATASSDQTAKLWDAVTGAELQTFSQHTGPLYCLAVSADGRTLVTGAQDNTVRVWDLPLSHPIRRVTAPGAAVMDFAFSPDGTLLLAGSADHSVRLIDLATHATAAASPAPVLPTALLRVGHTSDVLATAYRNDGTSFATADVTGHIMVWSPDLDQPLARLQAHPGKVTAIVLPNNDQRLASAGDDGIIRVWQLPTPSPKKLAASDVAGGTIAVLPGQQVAVYSLANGQCRLINLLTGEVQREFPQPDGETTQIAVSPTSAWFGRANTAGRMQMINVNDASIIGSIAGLTSARFDRDGAFVAVCRAQPFVQIVNVASGLVHEELATGFAVTDAGWTGQDQRSIVVVGAGNDGVLVQRAMLKLWDGIKNGATAVTLSPDQQFAFCAGADGTIHQWNLTDANPANVEAVKTYTGHTAPVTELSVSPNGTILCSVSEDKTLRVWKIADGSIVHAIEHPKAVASVSVSSDSTRVVTGCADGVLRLWDITTGQLMESFSEHTAETVIPCVRFLSDGQTIVSSGDDKLLITRRSSCLECKRRHKDIAGTECRCHCDGNGMESRQSQAGRFHDKKCDPHFCTVGAGHSASGGTDAASAVCGRKSGQPIVIRS